MVTPFVPGNQTAGQHYTQQLIEDLSAEYAIDLCYFRYTADAPYQTDNRNVRVIWTRVISTLSKAMNCSKIPFLHPLFTCRFQFRLARFLFSHRKTYDGFYFDFSQTFIYSCVVPGRNIYLMAHDVIAQKYARRTGWFNRLSYLMAMLSEHLVLRCSRGTILCFSNKDRDIIRNLYGLEAHRVDFYLGPSVTGLRYSRVEYTGKFAFFGAWGRPENQEGLIWFLDEVVPLLPPGVRLVVIGGGMPRGLQQRLADLDYVSLTGFVDDPYPLLAGCAGLIAPIFQGAGVKVKVVEALACGTPVIGSEVAFEGIEYQDGEFTLTCATPGEYAASIEKLSHITMTAKACLRENFLQSYPQQSFKDMLDHDL